MSDILSPVGRLVSGHPMELHPVKDEKTGIQKTMKNGDPQNDCSVGIAFAKGAEQYWNQTPWGQAIYAAAVAEWPRGEHGAPTFAWKIIDGDSAIPNKKGNKPCDREGYPGHWILFASSCFSIPSYHAGMYAPHQVIQDKNAIKRGDYVRLSFTATKNGSTDSPGMYINPVLMELTRAGIEIVSANAPDAAAAFGGVAAELPAGAMVDPNVTAAPGATTTAPPPGTATPPPGAATPPPVAAGPVDRMYQGSRHTVEKLLADGWTQAMIDQHTTPVEDTPPPAATTTPPPAAGPVPGQTDAPPPPATDLVTPPAATGPVDRMYQGSRHTVAKLLADGWTQAMIDQHTTPAA